MTYSQYCSYSRLACALVLSGGLWVGQAPQVSAEPVKTGAQLYLNLSGNGLADKFNGSGNAQADAALPSSDSASSTRSKQVDLGSIPLTISAADSSTGFDAVAGGKGQYVTSLSDRFSLFGHGGFSKSQSLTDGLLGSAAIDAGPGLEYRAGDLALALQPDIGISLPSDARHQMNYGVSSTVSKNLLTNLSASATTGYTFADSANGASSLANELVGMNYTFTNRIKLGLGYQLEQPLGTDQAFLSGKQGPSLSAQIPVTDTLSLGTNYAYTSDIAADGIAAHGRDVEQSLGLAADWNLGADINSDLTLNAKLNVMRESQIGDDAQFQKAGSVGMKMRF